MSQDNVRIDYDRKQVLGHGVYGIVFKGKFGGKEVAIKRTPLFFVMDLITKDEFLLRIRHPNVVIILHISRDEDFRRVNFISFFILIIFHVSLFIITPS